MTRPDLQPGYEGWQALDPTPQEKSEGGWAAVAPFRVAEMGTHSREGQRGILTQVWLTPQANDWPTAVRVDPTDNL